MNIRNEDIREVRVEVPEGHRHIRTRIILADGSEITLQEATVANIVRGYVTIKTHPQKTAVTLSGTRLMEKKAGYAEWQLLEE